MIREKEVDIMPFLLAPLILLDLVLKGFALYHIFSHENYRRGNRLLWVLVTVLVSTFGSILYFVLGKED